MTQREWYVNLSVNLNHVCDADDEDRRLIVLYLRIATDCRATGRRRDSEGAMNAASEMVKRACRKKQEAIEKAEESK
ncbi:MAG: hypothetical protein P4L67_04365 [Candidatus Pacebacteria bacterium]|nr:hypothetical protein [Candidatus Paceibacterota bacterium]